MFEEYEHRQFSAGGTGSLKAHCAVCSHFLCPTKVPQHLENYCTVKGYKVNPNGSPCDRYECFLYFDEREFVVISPIGLKGVEHK